MQNNQRHPNISFSNFSRTSEKQCSSLERYPSTDGDMLPKHQERFQNHDYLSAFWAVFWNTQRRISHLIKQRQHAVSLFHAKDLTSPSSSHSTIKFISLCALWYSSSALSSNTGKTILNQFRYPVTLTFVQFGFVALYCFLFMSPLVRFTRLRAPSKAILNTTLPMGMFQVGGHMFSSMAISRIPVSTVHTIKALSPLFTVAAYAILFRVSYSSKTYISLLPLTVGVMLACSFDISASSALGLLCAFGSALVFVSSNIFFKKIMPSNSGSPSTTPHKLDKLNLLLYSSSMAFLLMIPIWVYYDLPILLSGSFHPEYSLPKTGQGAPHSVAYYFFVNGTVHFAQNIIAFIILSSTSPVTYSIASLIKRVVVICIAIIWFQQRIHPIQGIGILMTFVGLYMYNQSKADVEKGEQKMRRVDAARALVLPTTREESRLLSGTGFPPPALNFPSQFDVPVQLLASASALERAPSLATTSLYYPAHPHGHQQLYPTSAGLKLDSNFHSSWSHTKNHSPSISPVDRVDSYPSPPPSTGSTPSRSHSLEVAQQAGS